MNRERAKELLPIIQAFIEGKKIQFQVIGFDKWVDVDSNPEFEDREINFRIKPEPQVIYVFETHANELLIKDEVKTYLSQSQNESRDYKIFIEVME